MDRPIVDGRWRVHINGEGGMMVSVDLIAMVTSEASDGHERRLRAKVTSEASYGYERSELWSCSMTLLWRKVLECSSSLLTSLSLCPHSYGGRFWSVLPHCSLRHPCDLTHFVIPVSSLLWRKVLECSSSLLTSSSLCPHSLRHPCVLTHFVIPVFSHP